MKLIKLISEIQIASKWRRQVNKITDPRVVQAWVDYYTHNITRYELIDIIKNICTGFSSEFYSYVDEMSYNANVPPSSSSSSLYSFYDWDFEKVDISNEEDNEFGLLIYNTYKSIIEKINYKYF